MTLSTRSRSTRTVHDSRGPSNTGPTHSKKQKDKREYWQASKSCWKLHALEGSHRHKLVGKTTGDVYGLLSHLNIGSDAADSRLIEVEKVRKAAFDRRRGKALIPCAETPSTAD
jgi:hypothetical protein